MFRPGMRSGSRRARPKRSSTSSMRSCHRLGRSDGASTSRRARTGDPNARSTDARSARSIAKGRDRKMVADYKVGWCTRRPIIRQRCHRARRQSSTAVVRSRTMPMPSRHAADSRLLRPLHRPLRLRRGGRGRPLHRSSSRTLRTRPGRRSAPRGARRPNWSITRSG